MKEGLITVKSTLPQNRDGSWPLALFERDRAHPGGEVYIANDKPVKVGQTAGVTGAITAGKLVVVSGDTSESVEAAIETADESGAAEKAAAESAGSDLTTGTPPAEVNDLPEDLPHRQTLIDGGVTSVAQLKAMSKEDVIALKGIGEASFKEIANYAPKK